MKYKPYQLHPHPWSHDRGTVKSASGDVIGNFVYSLGDETDHSSGRLMTRTPELLEVISLALRTIGDVLRSEPDLRDSNRDVLESISQDLRDALHDRS